MKKIIKDLNGCVIGIGLDKELVNFIEENKKISKCDLLESYSKTSVDKGKRARKIKIKKLRKIYKKNKIDYIICNYAVIKDYMNTFVKDSIYVNKNKIYYYNVDDSASLLKKYKRYKCGIKEADVISIDTNGIKTNIFKDCYFRVVDFISGAVEYIGDILMS